MQAPGEAAQGPQCSPAFGILSQGPVPCQVLCACSIALCLLVLCSINAINVASAAAPLQCAVLIDMGGFGMGWFFFYSFLKYVFAMCLIIMTATAFSVDQSLTLWVCEK